MSAATFTPVNPFRVSYFPPESIADRCARLRLSTTGAPLNTIHVNALMCKGFLNDGFGCSIAYESKNSMENKADSP